jgi:secreted protein with Ig-like and vWFA domain
VNKDLWDLNLQQLEALYDEASKDLKGHLLAGATWEEVSEQRRRVGELSRIIFKKINPAHFSHPAENDSRKDISR